MLTPQSFPAGTVLSRSAFRRAVIAGKQMEHSEGICEEEKDHSQGEARPGQPLQRVHSAPSRPGLRRGGADEALTGTKDDRPEF